MKITFTALFCCFFLMLEAQNYQNAESAEYDASQNRWLISNGSNILQRASDGTLSVFGNGSGSYGMEVMLDRVFVIDEANKIKAFNLETAMQEMTLTIEGAAFLNGLTNDGVGILYATDFSNKKIYKIDVSDINAPTYEVIVENTVKTPNGIVYDGENNRLLWVTWGADASVRAVNLADYSVSTIQTTTLSNIDGIDEDNEQNYYLASWTPARITKFDKDFINPPVTVTTPALNKPADIGYSKETDTLAIPMGNNVIYVGFSPISGIGNVVFGDFAMEVFPNPVSQNSFIQFELATTQNVDLTIYDLAGRVVQNLLKGRQLQGLHKVVLAGIALEKGLYLCRLQTENGIQSLKFVVGE